ncbi:MAG TPA: HAD family hydrolase [Treponemataceae bacterium]|nr:HAD family hydrolase [Treponemataceae bacterium]
MRSEIDAIAFDIDGTLYADFELQRRLLPFLIKKGNIGFLINFGRVRHQIRLWQEENPGKKHNDFFTWQASLMAPLLSLNIEETRKLIDDKIYKGWKPLFAEIQPFPYTTEAFEAFRASGLKLALLSDFLPEQKADVWGLAPLCDVVMGSENTGALKPSPVPFLDLASALETEPQRILYVGNSIRSDVQGASGVGMKTACITNPVTLALGRKVPGADISFSSYRQLTRIVLK